MGSARPRETIRVVLTNDSLTDPRSVLVRAAAATQAEVERLQASSAYPTTGVTLAGQSFGARQGPGPDGRERVLGPAVDELLGVLELLIDVLDQLALVRSERLLDR